MYPWWCWEEWSRVRGLRRQDAKEAILMRKEALQVSMSGGSYRYILVKKAPGRAVINFKTVTMKNREGRPSAKLQLRRTLAGHEF